MMQFHFPEQPPHNCIGTCMCPGQVERQRGGEIRITFGSNAGTQNFVMKGVKRLAPWQAEQRSKSMSPAQRRKSK